MFCKNCGKQIYEGSKACPYCGADLTQTVNKNMQIYQVKPEKNKSRTVIIVSIVCVLLVIITVAVVAFLMGQKSNEDNDSDDDDKKTEEVVEEVTTVTAIPFDEFEITEPEESTTRVPVKGERFESKVISVRVGNPEENTMIEYDNSSRKTSTCVAALNDCFSHGDYIQRSEKTINPDVIIDICQNEFYVEIVFDGFQKIKIAGDNIEFDEVLVATTGDCVDTMIFCYGGTYVGAYDVVKNNGRSFSGTIDSAVNY